MTTRLQEARDELFSCLDPVVPKGAAVSLSQVCNAIESLIDAKLSESAAERLPPIDLDDERIIDELVAKRAAGLRETRLSPQPDPTPAAISKTETAGMEGEATAHAALIDKLSDEIVDEHDLSAECIDLICEKLNEAYNAGFREHERIDNADFADRLKAEEATTQHAWRMCAREQDRASKSEAEARALRERVAELIERDRAMRDLLSETLECDGHRQWEDDINQRALQVMRERAVALEKLEKWQLVVWWACAYRQKPLEGARKMLVAEVDALPAEFRPVK